MIQLIVRRGKGRPWDPGNLDLNALDLEELCGKINCPVHVGHGSILLYLKHCIIQCYSIMLYCFLTEDECSNYRAP